MKSIRLFMLMSLFCCTLPALAQKTFGSAKYTAMCSYYGETIAGSITAGEASPAAEAVVENIMSVIGLRANFELRAANVPNAAAVILKNKRFILYNPKFMNSINSATGSNWAAISILAHEIGHHLSGHTLDNVGSRPATELEADEFSGFVLRRMGASLADAQAAMGLIASIKGSHSHPPKKDRLAYIANGWNRAGGVASANIANDSRPKPTAVQKSVPQPQGPAVKPVQRPVEKSVLPEKYIASDAYFTTNPEGKYYMTVKGNLVHVDNDNVYLLGSLSQSNKPGYKLMFSGNDSNLYISSNGTLVTNSGKRIGYLKARE